MRALVRLHHGKGCCGIGKVRDQGVEARPAFGLEDPRDGQRVGGVTPEAVDGLGREGHQLPCAQAVCRAVEGFRAEGLAKGHD